MILGDRSKIPEKTLTSFKRTGTIHLLAISGLHVGLIILIVRFLLRTAGASPYTAGLCSLIFLILYNIIVGFRPSVMRASLMLGMLFLGKGIKRKTDLFNNLGLACIFILSFSPFQAIKPGFVLSFGTVLSIVFVSKSIKSFINYLKS